VVSKHKQFLFFALSIHIHFATVMHLRSTPSSKPTTTFGHKLRARTSAPLATRHLNRVPKPSVPFDWSHSGKCYKVRPQPLVLVKTYGTQLYGHKIETNKVLPKLCVQMSTLPRAGKGVVAEEKIAQGQEVTKYGGEIIGEQEADERTKQVFKSNFKIIELACNSKLFDETDKGKGYHIKRIPGSNKYIDSNETDACPMETYVAEHQVAGFCNTKSVRRLCNAKFVLVLEEVLLVATRDIRRGEEIFAFYYDRKAQKALAKERKAAAQLRAAQLRSTKIKGNLRRTAA
jgi:hypothetical protein